MIKLRNLTDIFDFSQKYVTAERKVSKEGVFELSGIYHPNSLTPKELIGFLKECDTEVAKWNYPLLAGDFLTTYLAEGSLEEVILGLIQDNPLSVPEVCLELTERYTEREIKETIQRLRLSGKIQPNWKWELELINEL